MAVASQLWGRDFVVEVSLIDGKTTHGLAEDRRPM